MSTDKTTDKYSAAKEVTEEFNERHADDSLRALAFMMTSDSDSASCMFGNDNFVRVQIKRAPAQTPEGSYAVVRIEVAHPVTQSEIEYLSGEGKGLIDTGHCRYEDADGVKLLVRSMVVSSSQFIALQHTLAEFGRLFFGARQIDTPDDPHVNLRRQLDEFEKLRKKHAEAARKNMTQA